MLNSAPERKSWDPGKSRNIAETTGNIFCYIRKNSEVCMPSPTTHRRMARVFLTRAYETPTRHRKLKYFGLAVSNSVRARTLKATPADDRHQGREVREQLRKGRGR